MLSSIEKEKQLNDNRLVRKATLLAEQVKTNDIIAINGHHYRTVKSCIVNPERPEQVIITVFLAGTNGQDFYVDKETVLTHNGYSNHY